MITHYHLVYDKIPLVAYYIKLSLHRTGFKLSHQTLFHFFTGQTTLLLSQYPDNSDLAHSLRAHIMDQLDE